MKENIVYKFLAEIREEEISEENCYFNSVSDYYSSRYENYNDYIENKVYHHLEAHAPEGRAGFYGVPKPPLNPGESCEYIPYDESYEYD